MFKLDIPGFGALRLEHLALDYNGTMARDGAPLPGVRERLEALAETFEMHVVTADTFGAVGAALKGWPVNVHVLPPGPEDRAKLDLVRALGVERVAALGNGRNDRLMLSEATLGIALLQAEGLAQAALFASDLVIANIAAALDLFLFPDRLKAALRS
jgi:soluble P-type ATPase